MKFFQDVDQECHRFIHVGAKTTRPETVIDTIFLNNSKVLKIKGYFVGFTEKKII